METYVEMSVKRDVYHNYKKIYPIYQQMRIRLYGKYLEKTPHSLPQN